MRLSAATIGRLPSGIRTPTYDRQAQGGGVVHFGLGAFHRAHQAVFTDEAMAAGDVDWGIMGVSLRSTAVSDQLNPQDGLYSVTEKTSTGESIRVIGSVRGVIAAARAPAAVIEAVAAPGTRIVSLTVTEKGYCRGVDGDLDIASAGAIDRPSSVYGFIAAGLRRRRALGLQGVTLLSCDNLAGNGAVLSRMFRSYLDASDTGLGRWFAAECACPSTMVDRIVPAATPEDLRRAASALGLDDDAAVVTEPFSQWIIEDRFAAARPRWEAGGARFVADVGPYELAKLRMLNAAHSALAYLGLLRGWRFVHEAIADPLIAQVVDDIVRVEGATSFTPAPGQVLSDYADSLLRRFSNGALPHRLAQIATDGSQKIPQRWLATLTAQHAKGRDCPAILRALTAWMVFVRRERYRLNDPLADRLAALTAHLDDAGLVDAICGPAGLFKADWIATAEDRAALTGVLSAHPR